MRISWLVLSVFVSLPALAGKPLERVNICVPKFRTEYLAILAQQAIDLGAFRKRGLDARVVVMEKPTSNFAWKLDGGKIVDIDHLDHRIATAVASRRPDCPFGISNVERFLGSDKPAPKVRPLFVSYFGEDYDTHMVVAPDSPVKSVKDLKGKRIRLGQLPTFLGVTGALAANGLSLKDVEIEHGFGGPEKLSALTTGKVDAMTAYLPSMAYLLATGKVRVLEANVVGRYVGAKVPHSLAIVRANFAEQEPDVVKAFQEAIRESHEHLARNPVEIFHLFTRHRDLRGDWSSEGKQVDLEKAAAFIGQIKMVDLAKPGTHVANLACDARHYGEVIVKRG